MLGKRTGHILNRVSKGKRRQGIPVGNAAVAEEEERDESQTEEDGNPELVGGDIDAAGEERPDEGEHVEQEEAGDVAEVVLGQEERVRLTVAVVRDLVHEAGEASEGHEEDQIHVEEHRPALEVCLIGEDGEEGHLLEGVEVVLLGDGGLDVVGLGLLGALLLVVDEEGQFP